MANAPFENIDADTAQELIKEGKVKVVDVRQDYEYKSGHIEDATLVPINGLYDFSVNLQNAGIPKDQPVLFVCAAGQRSAAASEVAAIMGYQQVYNLDGGMNMWRYSGGSIVR